MTDRRPPPPPQLGAYRPVDETGRHKSRKPSSQQYRPSGRRPVKRPPRRSGLSILLVSIAVLALLAAGAIGALYVFSPTSLVRDELVRQVKQRTGRDLVIAGPTSLSLWGAVTASMADVSLSAPSGMGGAPLVRARRLGAEVALWPLLRGELIVDRVVLTEPMFEFRVDNQGRRSWDFADVTTLPVRYAQASKPGNVPPELADFIANASKDGKVVQAPVTRSRMGELAIGEVRVANGAVRYSDARSGVQEALTGIDLSITGRSLSQPMMANGGGNWRNVPVRLEARLASTAALMEGRSARLTLVLGSERGEARYEGSLALAQSGPQAEGAVSVSAPSARALATWLGAALAPSRGLGRLAVTGDVKVAASNIQLSRTTLQLDDAKAEGSVGIDLSGPRPSVRADLAISGLDLDSYLPDGTRADVPPARGSAQPASPPAAKKELSIEDLLRREGADAPPSAARVKGYTRRAGWSEEPISAAALKAVDTESRFTLGRFTVHGITIDSTVVRVGLRDGALTANLEDVRLYNGRGRGVVTLNAANPALPQVGLNLSADGVSALPLLKDAGDFDWIEGKARLQVALGGQGGTEKAIVESLNGRAEFTFTDGNVIGVDVPKLMRGLMEGKFSGFERRMADKTPFGELAASFKVAGGVADTRDLRLVGPELRLTGTGTVDLGKRQLDLSLRPRLATAGAKPGAGFEIPLRLTGGWDSPRLAPDLDAVLKDPSKTIDAVRDFAKQPGVSDGIKGVLDAVQGGDNRGARDRAKSLLDQFLKR